MKKFLFLGLAAMMAFTSCTKDETLATAELGAIGFENAFIDNATRAITPVDPSYNNSALMPNFNVYGFFDANYTDLLFDGTVVTVANGACSYNPIQYWAPNHTYYFQAIAPVSENWTLAKADNLEDAKKGPGVVTFTNVAGTEDLLYAKAEEKTEQEITAQPEKVGLTFQHLLSKVRFEFVNKFASETYSFEVKDVKINNAFAKGSVDLVNENNHAYVWTVAEADATLGLEFGNVNKMAQGVNDYAANERMLIPGKQNLNITFEVVLYANNSEVDTYSHEVEVPVELLMGYSYNFKAEVDATNVGGEEENALYPIEFTVTGVEDWIPFEGDVTIEETIPAEISTPAQLVAAFAQGGSFKLVEDITVPTSLFVEEGTAVTLDLNGKTLTNTCADAEYPYGVADVIVVYGQLTIEGEGTVTGPTRCVWARGETGAKVTINGGNYVGATADSFQDVAVYASGNGVVDIYGGTFETKTVDTESYAADIHSVLNVADKQGTINVYGGTFKGQNPAAPGTEPAGYDNFVAPGYGVIANGDLYTVVGGNNIALTENVTLTGSLYVGAELDGKGFTVTGAAVPTDNGMVRPAGNVTIKNITLDGNNGVAEGNKGIRAIFINDPGTYNLDNVTIKNVTYTINVNTTQLVTLNVSNSNLEGWTSFGESTTATFTNVKFTKGTYGNFKPYGQTTVTNCEFTNVNLDFSALVEPITFDKCTVNGVTLTADNIASFSENYEAVKGLITIK